MGIFICDLHYKDRKFWALKLPGSPGMHPIHVRGFLFSAINLPQPDAKDFIALSCIGYEQRWSTFLWLTLQGRNQISKVARLYANFYLIGFDWSKNGVLMWFWTLSAANWGINIGCILKFKIFIAPQKCDLHYTKIVTYITLPPYMIKLLYFVSNKFIEHMFNKNKAIKWC